MNDSRRNFIRKSASMATAVTVTGLYSCKNSGDNSEEKSNQAPSAESGVIWPFHSVPASQKTVSE